MAGSDQMDELRARAEEEVRKRYSVPEGTPDPEELTRLFHELQVHQIELEMQNEELRSAQIRLQEANLEMERARDRFTELYQQAPVGYVILDDTGLVLQANETFGEMVRLRVENIEKRSFFNLIYPEDQGMIRIKVKSFLKNEDIRRMEARLQRMYEEPFYALLEVRSVNWRTVETSKKGELLITISDISVRKSAETAMLEARREAERANLAKSEFLSRMSHELRTPLNAVLGFAQLLQLDIDEKDESRLEALEQILSGGNHLLQLINEVLDIARVDSGNIDLKIVPVNMYELVLKAMNLVAPLAGQGKIKIQNNVFSEGVTVLGDEQRLTQVAINLLSNAIKYNKPGGAVILRASYPLGKSEERTYLRLTVSDTGIGIPEAEKYRVFDPFIRGSQEYGKVEGSGIGLTITKKIVELMKGRIGFHSIVNSGSEFWIDMPLVKSTPEQIPEGLDNKANVSGRTPARMKILYVDENPEDRRLVERILAKYNSYELFTAPNVAAGLEFVREIRPEAILMDLDFSNREGIESLRRFQTELELSQIPIIALGADGSPESGKKALTLGFVSYLSKPLDISEFLNELKRIQSRR